MVTKHKPIPEALDRDLHLDLPIVGDTKPLNWSPMIVHVTQVEVRGCVNQRDWQVLRLSLQGTSLKHRYRKLLDWLQENSHDRTSQVQVANYVNALKRGGMIK